MKLTEMIFGESEKISSCNFCDPFVVILQKNKLSVLKWDDNGISTIHVMNVFVFNGRKIFL
jgi:hypothetical protein